MIKVGLLAGAALLGSSVSAQQGPLFDNPDELRIAYATEATGLELETLLLDADTEDEAAEEAEESEEGEEEEGVGSVLPLFAGSLEAQDPELLAELEAAMEEVEEQSESGGEGLEAAVRRAQELVMQARDTLIAEELRADPVFQAGTITMLSLLEPGVGEGYEEAAEGETEAYYIAWVGLQRIKEMWAEVAPSLPEDADTSEVERPFEVLDGLIASPQPPERFSDPEDAEGAVNDLAFGLERATGSTLLPRELSSVAELSASQIAEACAAVEAGQPRMGAEQAGFVYALYDKYLERALMFVAMEASETIDEGLESLQADPASDETSALCRELPQALEEARIALGGQ
jgi:hypothetical protein